tara:strand:- start:4086 stop:4655 length:570 start_codon:yes stop_codon:yes gene_type:complete
MSKIIGSKQKNKLIVIFTLMIMLQQQEIQAEMIIGTGSIEPGVDLIFEGGVKDDVMPNEYFLSESETDVHIEVLANWSSKAPNGSPEGGHVAYLNVNAVLINEATGKSVTHKLTPHVNMSDNLHYAKNIKLPGRIDQRYTVIFEISPPKNNELGMHYDWRKAVDEQLIDANTFEFQNLDFEKIAQSKRR